MNSKLTKLFITILTILVSSLLANFFVEYIDEYYKGRDRFKNVALGMFVMVAVYYPMTTFLESYFQKISKKMISKSKKIANSNALGMFIGFSIAIFVLFLCYAKVWYNWNVIKTLINKIQ